MDARRYRQLLPDLERDIDDAERDEAELRRVERYLLHKLDDAETHDRVRCLDLLEAIREDIVRVEDALAELRMIDTRVRRIAERDAAADLPRRSVAAAPTGSGADSVQRLSGGKRVLPDPEEADQMTTFEFGTDGLPQRPPWMDRESFEVARGRVPQVRSADADAAHLRSVELGPDGLPQQSVLADEKVGAASRPSSGDSESMLTVEFGPDGFPTEAGPRRSPPEEFPKSATETDEVEDGDSVMESVAMPPAGDSPAVPPELGIVEATSRGSFAEGTPDRDEVDCTVYAPLATASGCDLSIQVFAHSPAEWQHVQRFAPAADRGPRLSGATSLASEVVRGSTLAFELSLHGLRVDEPLQQLVWRGRAASVQFSANIPAHARAGTMIGKIAVSQDSVPIGAIRFKLRVLDELPAAIPIPQPQGKASRFERAYICCASEDRGEVVRRVQMLAAVGIEHFAEALDLDPVQRWEQGVYRQIDKSDVLFLFWSSAARRSPWVEKEWQYGLKRKGGDFIRPVMLEGPPYPPPPAKLAFLRFGERLPYFVD